MIAACAACGRVYDDAARWTICPHPSLDQPAPALAESRAAASACDVHRGSLLAWLAKEQRVLAQQAADARIEPVKITYHGCAMAYAILQAKLEAGEFGQ